MALIPLFGTWKKAITRRQLLRMYHLALAQMRGGPTRGTLTSPEGLSPEEQLSAIVELLAEVDGNDQAARLLGLTPGEVAAHREHARQIHLRIFLRHRSWGSALGE